MAAATNILLKLDRGEIRTAIDSMKTKPYKRKNCPVTLSEYFVQRYRV